MSWTRTFDAPVVGVYQVVLPFHPGEWEQDPITGSYAVTYSWHPDGTVRRVAFYLNVNTPGLVTVTAHSDPVLDLPGPPSLRIHQDFDQWQFLLAGLVWDKVNAGVLALRGYVGRLLNENGNRCEFGVSAKVVYYGGREVLTEIRLTGCQPLWPTQRNWPLQRVTLNGQEILGDVTPETVGDQMSVVYRDDKIVYAICNEWEGHACGSNGVDYTKVKGGNSTEIIGAAASHSGRAWYDAFWGHPYHGPSGGLHGEFGVCRIDVAAGVQDKSLGVWPALHALCSEWTSSPYHLIDESGEVLVNGLDYPNSWSTVLGQPDRFKHPYPIYGKSKDAERPDVYGRVPEDNAHVRSHALSCIMEFAPTPLYLEEVTRFRAETLLNIYSGEERAYARVGGTGLETLPFITGGLRARMLSFLSGRMRWLLSEAKRVGYRNWRNDGPRDIWIPGKKVFLPWQMGMFFGHVWAAHLSGYPELELTMDERNTVMLTMDWLTDNTWRQLSDGSWNHAYATAVDLTDHHWGDFGIAAQSIAGLECISEHPRAKLILAWFSQSAEADRWYPVRPGPVVDPPPPPPATVEIARVVLESHRDDLVDAVADVDRWLE